jgi:hypothetical protein
MANDYTSGIYTPGDSYQEIPVPGFIKPTHTYGYTFGDEFHAPTVFELLASTEGGFTQRGVILAGGQGVIPTGTVLGQYTSGANQYLYGVYNASHSDGSQIPLGFLRNGVDTGGANSPSGLVATNVAGLLVDRGILNYAVISGLDANAITLLAGRIDNAVQQFFF